MIRGDRAPLNPKTTITLASDTGPVVIPVPIAAATLNFSAKTSPHNILIGYGNSPILRFENTVSN